MGSNTYSIDTTLEALENNGLNNIYDFSAAELAETLERHSNLPIHIGWDEDHLGMVLWGLVKGKKVPVEHLKIALDIAKKMLHNTDYLKYWTNPTDRVNTLKQEIRDIEYALANNGLAPSPKNADTTFFAKIRSTAVN
jgi:hypothetical protein